MYTGTMLTIGIDEVGRGCWAGPLVAGAAYLPDGFVVPLDGGWKLADSKRLTARQRQAAANGLQQLVDDRVMAVGLGWVAAAEVDELGVSQAVATAMRRAYRELLIAMPEHIGAADREVVIDGSYNFMPEIACARTLVKADATIPAVSAASIMAKVARDSWMVQAAGQFPGYGFEKHVGYGTQYHADALSRLGVCSLHRRSYKPVRALL